MVYQFVRNVQVAEDDDVIALIKHVATTQFQGSVETQFEICPLLLVTAVRAIDINNYNCGQTFTILQNTEALCCDSIMLATGIKITLSLWRVITHLPSESSSFNSSSV